jgi:segregation and condensation protein B
MEDKKLVLEALLFATNQPIKEEKITEILEISSEDIKSLVLKLNEEYKSNHSFEIKEIAGGYQIFTTAPYYEWIKKLYQEKKKLKLTRSSLETLAIIAYQQPITKPEIDTIRGVDSGYIINSLLDKGLIDIAGRKKTPGRPLVFATTEEFLKHFGLKSIVDLPSLEELGISIDKEIKEKEETLPFEENIPGEKTQKSDETN